ncbi:hypothetical protein DL93DRAFT_1636960 [Clavulina sp. PMI_390]|nr:hypothetical protein DL93DRAFT_1636960 [Clavulina sp. PMI_390]
MQCLDSGGLKVTSPSISVISTLRLQYPTGPEVGTASTIQWSGGVSPYTVYVLSSDKSTQYYKYTGSSLSGSWTPSSSVSGLNVLFQVTDSNGVTATSNPVTVGDGGAGASNSLQSVLSTESIASVASVSSVSVASVASVASQTTTANNGPTSQSSPTQGPTSGSNPTSNTGATNSGTVKGTSTSTSSGQPTQTGGGGNGGGGGGKSSTNVGAIAGGVVGGVLGLALLALLAIWARRSGMCGGQSAHDDFEDAGFEKGASEAAMAGGAAGGAYGAQREPTVPNVQPDVTGNTGYASNPFGNPAGYPHEGGYGAAAAMGAGAGAAGGYYAGQQQQGQHPYNPYPQTGGAEYYNQGGAYGQAPGSPTPSFPNPNLAAGGMYAPQPGASNPSTSDPRTSVFSENATSLPYAASTGAGSHAGPGAARTMGSTSPPPGSQPHGWSGLPEVQS